MIEPIALTIGFFDGVHLGHRALFASMQQLACKSVVLTFMNHPAPIFGKPLPRLITPWPLKRHFLSKAHGGDLLSLSFSPYLASQSFEEFLAPYPIRHLILGEGSSFGKDRLGTPAALAALGKKRGFDVHVIPKFLHRGTPISSTRIRELILAGHLEEAEALLGRPHCLYFPLDPASQALPPDGDYPIWIYDSTGCSRQELLIRQGIPLASFKSPCLASFSFNPSLAAIPCHQTSPAAL